MKLSVPFAPLAVIALAAAQDFACIMNGREISVVDSETGVCEFPISNLLAVLYDYKNSTSFEATTYFYETTNGDQIYNDFAGKGSKISVPSIILTEAPKSVEWKLCQYYDGPGAPRDVNSEKQLQEKLLNSPSIILPNWAPMLISGHKVYV